jgi:hypothetical protein
MNVVIKHGPNNFQAGFDWQSKTRGEIHFEERPLSGGDWDLVRNHWQLMLSIDQVEDSYPYLVFSAEEEAETGPLFYVDGDGDYRPSSVWETTTTVNHAFG